MIDIKYVEDSDKEFWYSLDKHLPETEFYKKVRDKQGYVLFDDGNPVGLLRYNLFWDNTPFCTMLFVDWSKQKKGYGMAMTSTQVDEEAQHFYRKLGYKDCGGFTIDIPGFEQPMEMFMSKGL